ncbi:type II toxin-antitoxin system VapC family toxin [Mycobacterium malmoense]|uniref:type II toxin-antitoxin system VapC family toxin n=1 Tax=Mycobacterium malmoense TaxID=1780 RepID=UPI0008F90549|nr:type II toxin-antitoxin system VapC family toxin [Mycobacterium malmoense]OIN81656.1 VapC toxin family PIN domain ribonuclease [Mycobacterium malmoense]
MTGRRLSVDTSVAVPLLVASHERHQAVAEWARGRSLSLSSHALAETYSVLTRLPGDARVAPADAVTLIDENFDEVLVLSAIAARGAHRELAANGVAGGATYDGLVALAGREHGAVLVSRDARARSTYETLGVAVEVLVGAAGPAQ